MASSDEAKIDGAAVLSKVSGLSRGEIVGIWDRVKENSAKLRACERHKFSGRDVKLGQKMVCENCGGSMSLTDIGGYIRGYQAAGGYADDVWPDFERSRS